MEVMIPAGPAVLPVVLVLVGIVAILVALMVLWRQRALDERHAALDLRVTQIEQTMVRIVDRFDDMGDLLKEIRQEGLNNRDLLHLIIRGHMPDRN